MKSIATVDPRLPLPGCLATLVNRDVEGLVDGQGLLGAVVQSSRFVHRMIHRTIADYRQLVATFHPTKNAGLRPADISRGSDRKVWWKCPRGPDHEWQATPLHRTRPSGGNCPFCLGKRVSKTNSLATRNGAVARQWHPSKNASLTPHDVVAGSEKKVWWKCAKGPDHEWSATIASRALQDGGCPFCAGKRVSITNCLATTHPTLAKEWHPTLNGSLNPRQITPGTVTKVWWRCRLVAKHAWPSTIHNRVKGNGCPLCRGLGFGQGRTLAAKEPEAARMWHPSKNGNLRPSDVTAHAERRVWWKCPKGPDHEFQREIRRQVEGKEKCPFCSNDRVSVTNNLAVLFPRIAGEWHPRLNGKLTARDVVPGSGRVVWWRCDRGHEYRAYLPSRTARGTGCPVCRYPKRRPATTRRIRERVLLPSDFGRDRQSGD